MSLEGVVEAKRKKRRSQVGFGSTRTGSDSWRDERGDGTGRWNGTLSTHMHASLIGMHRIVDLEVGVVFTAYIKEILHGIGQHFGPRLQGRSMRSL